MDVDPNQISPERIIAARSRRQVMDWSLALASQEIQATILQNGNSWALAVDDHDFKRAEAVLRQYVEENRGWRWKVQFSQPGLAFHYGAAIWVAAIAGFYYWTMVAYPQLQAVGMLKNAKVIDGQWWRLFTAITLHKNLSHLISNAGTGFLLIGLAMARYGPGIALLMAFLAGAAGNGLDLLIHSSDSQSLGASGMVTGALGMLSVHSFAIWRKYQALRGPVTRAAAAGFLILVLTGFEPGSDVAAHLGGYFAGAIFGIGLNGIRPRALQRGGVNVAAALALAVLVTIAWRQAMTHP